VWSTVNCTTPVQKNPLVKSAPLMAVMGFVGSYGWAWLGMGGYGMGGMGSWWLMAWGLWYGVMVAYGYGQHDTCL